jgi:hypothetical protein
MGSPQRSFDLVSFSTSSYPDSEIAAYVQVNPALFRVAHFSKITITSGEREARQILTSIRNGTETFEDAARTKSTDYYAENSGDMGSRMAFELIYDIPDEQAREELLRLQSGEISEVIKISDTAWALFRSEERVRPADSSDPAAMEKIRNYIMTYERGRVEDWLLEDARKFIASVNVSDFDSAAADRGITKKSFGPLPINYGDTALFPSVSSSGINELNNVGNNERFWKAAFSAALNTPSEPVIIGANVVVFFPLEETESDPENTNLIDMYYSYWLSTSTEQGFRSFFLNNEKLDDRFWDIFQQLIE